jgi:hypothetical protein
MSTEELHVYVKRLRELSSPQTLTAALSADSERIKSKRAPGKSAKRQALLDAL